MKRPTTKAVLESIQGSVNQTLFSLLSIKEKLSSKVGMEHLNWVWQDGTNKRSRYVRMMICCRIFLPQMQHLSASQIASMIGVSRQSLSRWLIDFKKAFPDIHV
jgi:hypothetical protein